MSPLDQPKDPAAIAPQKPSRRLEKPKRPPIQSQKLLENATNTNGVVFSPGDLIEVQAPWGGKATAEIVKLIQDLEGNAWAEYIPKESRPNWSWEKGLARALRLKKA